VASSLAATEDIAASDAFVSWVMDGEVDSVGLSCERGRMKFCSRVQLVLAAVLVYLCTSGVWAVAARDCELRVAVAADLFVGSDGAGPYAGLARDLVALVGRKAGCTITFVSPDAPDVDMVLGYFLEESVESGVRYSPELLRVPAILVGRDSGASPAVDSELSRLRIGVGGGYGLAAFAKEHGGELNFEPVESDLFGLMKVSIGELDLMLIDLATASQLIEEEGITNLHLVARLGPLFHLRLRVEGGDPKLAENVIEACGRIAWYERRALTEKWLGFGALPFYRSPLFWRWATGVLLFTVLVIGNVLLWNRALRKEVHQRKRMARDILSISSDERARIGRDLHDSIGQQLVGVTYLAGMALDSLEGKAFEEAASTVERLRTHTEEAIRQTRFVVRGLLPVDLRKEGLAVALEKLVRDTNANSRITCVLHVSESMPAIPVTTSLQLYRIVQEGVGNALKHGEVSEVTISLTRRRKRWCQLRVLDDGKGIQDASSSEGMGLKIMRYRAQIIGGRLRVSNRQPHGTEVRCGFPVRVSKPRGGVR
jgi:signal transduction histidine kinase